MSNAGTIEEITDYLAEVFSPCEIAVEQVAAKMPSSCWGRYCHLRVYRAGALIPKGANLRLLKEGRDYVEYASINVPDRKTARSQYGRVFEAVRRLNAELVAQAQ